MLSPEAIDPGRSGIPAAPLGGCASLLGVFGLAALQMWSPRRWAVAVGASIVTALALGLPTDVIPNPVFGRQGTPVTWWSYPVLLITSVLTGLLFATYVRDQPAHHNATATVTATAATADELDRPGRLASIGGLLSFFAIGCPICNKVVIVALGAAGAVKWFAPVQPYLGLVSLGLVGWALSVRLRGEVSCPVSVEPTPQHGEPPTTAATSTNDSTSTSTPAGV